MPVSYKERYLTTVSTRDGDAEVRKAVRRRIDEASKGGIFILSDSNSM